jgi:membrane associated rhomboid family serine protease
VLAAYLILYPRKRVRVVIFYFLTEVPAIVAIGLWFVFQVISGIGVLGTGSQEGGIAYGAHVGGFVAGLVLVGFFLIGRRKKI